MNRLPDAIYPAHITYATVSAASLFDEEKNDITDAMYGKFRQQQSVFLTMAPTA